MFLLSDVLIRRYRTHEGLQIDPFSTTCCRDNAYYFRLGDFAVSQHTDERVHLAKMSDYIEIPPLHSFWVKSRERFLLPDRVQIRIGQPTSLGTRKALKLVHGPSINPGYGATRSDLDEEEQAVPIEVALLNFGPRPMRVNFSEEIGKLEFFDISDSSLQEVRALGVQAREREARLRGGNPYDAGDN